jgi:hypothetical protein
MRKGSDQKPFFALSHPMLSKRDKQQIPTPLLSVNNSKQAKQASGFPPFPS